MPTSNNAYATKFIHEKGEETKPTEEAMDDAFKNCVLKPKKERYPDIAKIITEKQQEYKITR